MEKARPKTTKCNYRKKFVSSWHYSAPKPKQNNINFPNLLAVHFLYASYSRSESPRYMQTATSSTTGFRQNTLMLKRKNKEKGKNPETITNSNSIITTILTEISIIFLVFSLCLNETSLIYLQQLFQCFIMPTGNQLWAQNKLVMILIFYW